jgi:exodeoxyribonuclease-3
LRLVSWNCLSSLTPQKQAALCALNPDIAVVPEARLSNLTSMGLSERQYAWVGPSSGHGLAVVTSGSWRVDTNPQAGDDELFLPVTCSDGTTSFQLLAVCTKPKPAGNYIGALTRSIEAYRDWIAARPTILAGDFNASVVFNRSGPKFRRLLDQLDGMGLCSAWHAFHGQEHGKETAPTLYQTKKRNAGYHIDFVFLPSMAAWKPKAVAIGTFDDWVLTHSDHVPVVVDVDL